MAQLLLCAVPAATLRLQAAVHVRPTLRRAGSVRALVGPEAVDATHHAMPAFSALADAALYAAVDDRSCRLRARDTRFAACRRAVRRSRP